MGRRTTLTVCTVAGCPTFTKGGGRCTPCQRDADQARGTARTRGYDTTHETKFRAPVLLRDPVCVVCRKEPSKHADHYPVDRRELVRRGLDPNDPARGRGVCGPCHASATATEQPGGWNRRA